MHYKWINYYYVYYILETSVSLEYTPLIIFIQNYIRDSSGIFSISSLVKISLISSLFLKLYLILLVYDQNIFGSSWKVFGNLQESSEFLENVLRHKSQKSRLSFLEQFSTKCCITKTRGWQWTAVNSKDWTVPCSGFSLFWHWRNLLFAG